jgi:hypothetical protein
MDALAAAIGRGRDRLMTDEWLSAKKRRISIQRSLSAGVA